MRNVRFRKIWHALFSWNTRLEIYPFALLPTIFMCRIQALSFFFNNNRNRWHRLAWIKIAIIIIIIIIYRNYHIIAMIIISISVNHIVYYQNQIIASNSFLLVVTKLKSLWCLLRNFKRTLTILHFFASFEITRLTNRFMKFKKELWLLQAIAILAIPHLAPTDV